MGDHIGLVTKIAASFGLKLTGAPDKGTTEWNFGGYSERTLESGVGTWMADKVYSKKTTIAASGTATLDLSALTGPDGVAVNFAKVKGILDPEGERRGAGTWPFGECRVTPLEGTGEGRVVWDVCGHAPPGRYGQPVVLTVERGRVVKIEGGKEADGVRRYLETYGDENSYAAPAEISVGLNHKATIMGTVRNDKKALGTAHIAIGRSDKSGNQQDAQK